MWQLLLPLELLPLLLLLRLLMHWLACTAAVSVVLLLVLSDV
jgi:hypothetical protein